MYRNNDVDHQVSSTHNTVCSILRLVRALQPISRAELARRLGVNRSTVTGIVKPLMASGTLSEESIALVGRNGRPPLGLYLRAEGHFFVGVKIGVRRTHVGTMTGARSIDPVVSFDTPSDVESALVQVGTAVARLLRASQSRSCAFVGVSVPGPVDARRRRLLKAPQLGWHDVEIADRLSRAVAVDDHCRVVVTVENDATAVAVYELQRKWRNVSDDRSPEDFLLVRVGPGIGVGIVIRGEVYRGTGQGQGMAGEFGHMTVVAGGKQCLCGNRGCWERYGSASSATALYGGDHIWADPAASGFNELVARAVAGVLRARRVLEQTGKFLGIGIANMINGLGISQVIISGEVAHGWDFIRTSLHENVRRTMNGCFQDWSVTVGELQGAGLRGSLEVAIDEYLVRIADSARPAIRDRLRPGAGLKLSAHDGFEFISYPS
jgi:N-acetylglucosamine repressor